MSVSATLGECHSISQSLQRTSIRYTVTVSSRIESIGNSVANSLIMSLFNVVKQLSAFVFCVIAIDIGYYYWDDCPVDKGIIPISMMYAGLSGVMLLLSTAVIRPEIQFGIGIYNSITILRNIQQLNLVDAEYIDASFGTRCPYQLHFATVLLNMIIFALWFHHLLMVLAFLKQRQADEQPTDNNQKQSVVVVQSSV